MTKFLLRPAIIGQVKEVGRSYYGNPIASVSYAFTPQFDHLTASGVHMTAQAQITSNNTSKDASAGYSASNFSNKHTPVVLVMHLNRRGDLEIDYIEKNLFKAISHFLKPKFNYRGKEDIDGLHMNDDAREAIRVAREFEILNSSKFTINDLLKK